MLEVSLQNVSARILRNVSITFPASTTTAISGPPASGASTLLQLIAGKERAAAGEIRIGTRVINDLRASQRPLLHVTSDLDVPQRWSVRHALVAAVRQRTLDRVDRQHEYSLAIDKWSLGTLIDRKLRTLSESERTLVHLAQIELLRPGILLADRIFERLNPAGAEAIVDSFYRTLRVAGTTVITVPAMRIELGSTDRIVVLSEGRVVQDGAAAHVYARPNGKAAALATGDVNLVPITISGNEVSSIIGSWSVTSPPFQGEGVALVRPESFSTVAAGEESDLIVAVEEANFENGRWLVRAILSGAFTLRIALPAASHLHKGKLMALKFDASAFTLTNSAV